MVIWGSSFVSTHMSTSMYSAHMIMHTHQYTHKRLKMATNSSKLYQEVNVVNRPAVPGLTDRLLCLSLLSQRPETAPKFQLCRVASHQVVALLLLCRSLLGSKANPLCGCVIPTVCQALLEAELLQGDRLQLFLEPSLSLHLPGVLIVTPLSLERWYLTF